MVHFKVENTEVELRVQLDDLFASLKARLSYNQFASRFSEQASSMNTARDEYHKLLKSPEIRKDGVETAISKLSWDLEGKRKTLLGVAELKENGWVIKKSATKSAFEKARREYVDQSLKFENFLSGAEKYKISEDKSIGVPEKLSDAFREFKSTLQTSRNIMGNPFGMARINGFQNIGETISHNLKGLRFWEEGVVPKERVAPVAFRSVALVGAGVGIGDAVLRKHTADGEDRGALERIAELAASVGVGGVALLAGRAL